MFKKLLVLISLGFMLSACSTQRRESLPQLTEDELIELMGEFGTVTAASSDILAEENDINVFHARDSVNRPVESVLALYDLGFLLPSTAETNWEGLNILDSAIAFVDVLFVDSIVNGGDRFFALLVKMEDSEGNIEYYKGASTGQGDYKFTDDSFSVSVPGANGETVILSTKDVSEDYNEELGDSIKLRVQLDVDGDLFDAGNISTLHGYQFSR